MGKEIEAPVKLKIKSQKDGFNVVIKTKVIGSEAVPLAETFIEALKTRGFSTVEDAPPKTEAKEAIKENEQSAPVCPIHHKELVVRKGKFGDFWACPTKDEKGNWCQWRPEKKKA